MDVTKIRKEIEGMNATEIVAYFTKNYTGKIALSSSLSIEDQVLTDMVCKADPSHKKCRIFTLDTGRLFAESYSLIERTNMHFGINMEVMFPNHTLVENMVHEQGINLFYKNIESRKRCCNIRKIEPLKRAFDGLEVWICGLRKEQSITRADLHTIEWDNANNLIKVNPLIDWSEQQTWDYIKKNNIPYNKLYDKGFKSIGCEPCTRAVAEGEDIRAGRWWWENPDQKECGLHSR